MTVGVVIGTFGDRSHWKDYVDRAWSSVESQTVPAHDIVWCHADSLQEARNQGAATLAERPGGVEWLIFLDADDELDAGYIQAMEAGWGDVRRPATLGVYEDGSEDDHPVLIPERDLTRSNYIVIGAMVRSKLFFEVGGFDDYPILEDWALWRKCRRASAVIGDVPDAIYRVHVRPGSRNTDEKLHAEIYRRIIREVPL